MEFDVVVVGASSAGLYAAEKLARAGKRVAVCEQSRALSHVRRTLIVTPRLTRMIGQLPSQVVLHRIDYIDIESRDRTAVRVPLAEPDLIIERRALIQYLAERARAAGAQLFWGHRFRGFTVEPGGARLAFQALDGEWTTIRAAQVIGADGVFSDVASSVGIPHPDSAPILQAEVCLPQGWDPRVTKVWLDTDDTSYFYWLIPESAERAVVGLVGDERSPLRATLQAFLERQGMEPLAFQGARIALHRPNLQRSANVGEIPVLLVGDAAGQVKVSTVGGTVSGLMGAEAAVRSLLRRTPFRQELAALNRELNLHYAVRRVLARLDNEGYSLLVQSVNPQVQAFLTKYNRDEFAPHALELAFLLPAFFKLAWRLVHKPNAQLRASLSAPPSQTDPAT